MDKNKNFIQSYIEIFTKLSFQQKMFIGGIFVVMIVLLGFIFLFVNQPNYSTLYTNLSVDDASKVVEYLNSAKIAYKLDNNETTIKIPSEKIYEVRLALAAKGVPSSGVIGYEIFDKNTMGMSEFMQKLNFKRALEGEISKTIMQQKGVDAARVHIVFPEKAIFKAEQKEPSASVVLKINSRMGLTIENIQAIKHLVASSVEGLKPTKVTIVDTNGKLLSEDEDETSLVVRSGKQYEIKGKVEDYLAKKAQSILDNVLGFGNSVVKVNVELDFKKVERTMETFDPESQVAISESSTRQESGGTTISDSTLVSSQNTTTNYELSKTIERVVDDAGNIKRITVAAVINGIQKTIVKEDGTKEKVVEPRSNEQVQKLQQIISQAVGIDQERNDKIEVVSIPFENNLDADEVVEASPMNNMEDWSNLIMMIIALGAALFIIKSLMNKLKNEKIVIGTIGPGSYGETAFNDLVPGRKPNLSLSSSANKAKQLLGDAHEQMMLEEELEPEISPEAQTKKMKKEKIVTYVQKNPTEAAKLINSWLREDEYK